MHYYKRNIGDYAKKAGRLSMLEHGAYTLLMDAIYDRETFPTLEEALDWAWARDDAEVAAIKFVLSKFFTLDGDRYVQKRIQDELDSYKAKAETNARIAKDREAKRKSKHELSRNVHEACEEKHEPSPNHKPLTINQEPLTTNQEPETTVKKKTSAFAPCDMPEISQELAEEYIRHRKAVKAPLSRMAWSLFVGEAKKAGWTVEEAVGEAISRGWRSFKADWVQQKGYVPSVFGDVIEGECYAPE